jgi:transposase-like protein
MSTPKQRKVTEEFKREAVRLTETSGRTVAQVAGDLGIEPRRDCRRQKFVSHAAIC